MEKTLLKNAECTELMLDLFLTEAELTTRELYKRALNIVVKISDSKLGFFHQVSDNQREIIFTTWNDEALKNFHPMSDDHYPVNSAGIWADCIREKRPVICNSLLQAQGKKGFPPGHPKIDRMLSVPLILQDKVKLIFVLGNKEVDYNDTDLARVEAVITELHKVFRKRSVESALKKREERMYQILEGSELLIWEVDQTAKLTYISYSKVNFLGRTIEEVVGNAYLFDFIDAEESALQDRAREMFSQQQSFSNFIHPSRHKDGHLLFLETNGIPFFSEKGLFLGYRGATKDVTDRIQTAEKLEESELLFRDAQRAASVGSYKEDLVTGQWTCTEVLDQILGIDQSYPKDRVGWTELIHPDDREMLNFHHDEQVVAGKSPFNREFRIIRKSDGEIRWVQALGGVTHDEKQNKDWLIGTIQDISRRKLTEEQLHSSDERWRSIVKTSPDGISIASPDGTILYLSDKLYKWHGFQDASEMIGRSIFDFLSEESVGATKMKFSRMLAGEAPKIIDCEVLRKDGSHFYLEVNPEVIRDSSGNIESIFMIERDITQRKIAEKTIEQQNRELQMLNGFALKLSMVADSESIEHFIADALRNYTGLALVAYSDFLPRQSAFITREIDAEEETLRHLRKFVGQQLLNQVIPFTEEEIQKIRTQKIRRPSSLNFVSIGVVPEFEGEKFLASIGLEQICRLSLTVENELIGLLHFFLKAGETLPSDELLNSISVLSAEAIKRRRAEEALKQSQTILEQQVAAQTSELISLSGLNQAIVDHAGIAIISTDQNGIIQTFNTAAHKKLGYSATEVIGKITPIRFFDPEELLHRSRKLKIETSGDELQEVEIFATLLHGHDNYKGQWVLLRKDGSKFPVILTLSTYKNADGSLGGYIAMAMDIEKEIKMMNELRESEERFHKMFHDHSAIMLIVDPDTGEIVDANKSADTFYGFDSISSSKANIADINCLTQEQIKTEMRKAYFQQRNYFEFPHRKASGEICPVEVHSTPIDVAGKRLLFSVIHDISERRKMELELEISQKTLFQVTDNVPVIISLVNKNLEFTFTNNTFRRIFSIPERGCNGQKIEQIIGKEAYEKAYPYLLQALQGQTVTFENEIKTPTGQIRTNRITYTPYYQNDEIFGVLTSGIDITDRARAEFALRWNEALLKQMTESSPLAFLVVDNRTDEILYINHRFCEIWGIDHLEDAIRKRELKNNDIIPDCLPVLVDIPAFAESCKPLQSEENRAIVEDEIPFVNGRTIRRFSSQIRDAEDQYHGRLYIFEEITYRKNYEKLIVLQRDLATQLSATNDLQKALQLTLDALFQVQSIDAGGIYLLDSTNFELNLAVHKGLSDDFITAKSKLDSDTPEYKIVAKGEPIYGLYRPENFTNLVNDEREHLLSLAVIPIKHEGKVIGALNLASRHHPDFYENIQISIEALAFQLGGTISRINAERALLSSQLNFRMMFDTINDFMFILDMEGSILLTNSVVERRLGYTTEELRQFHVLDVHPPERRNEAGSIVEDMLAGKAAYCPVPLKAKDGTLIPVETHVILGKWDGRDALFGISRDVTEREMHETALRMQSAAFESFALAIIITDVKGRIQWANSGFTRLTGYQMEEFIGKHCGEIIGTGQKDSSFFGEMWSTILGGQVWSGEIINRRKDGTLYPEEQTITPVLDYNGEIRNFIAIKIDITDRKRFEESLQSAIAKEKELNELKSRFVSMASHEFRTPLASILMMSDSLKTYRTKMNDDQIEQKLTNIKEPVQHLAKVVTDVMQIAKIQEGKLSFDPQMIDLIALCNTAIMDFNLDSQLKNKIRLECDIETLPMMLDARLMVQVLNNLLSNAIKYAQPDPIVKVKIAEQFNQIQLSIKDNGIGIPEENQKNLFFPFYRADNVRQIQGNGLGLSIVKESVRLHGGDITFKSALGKGCTFVVHLPKMTSLPEG